MLSRVAIFGHGNAPAKKRHKQSLKRWTYINLTHRPLVKRLDVCPLHQVYLVKRKDAGRYTDR